MLSRIRAGVAGAFAVTLVAGIALAGTPTVADLDAQARSTGNRREVAQRIGETVFGKPWPVQITQISANQLGAHLIVGIRMWGVKFHRAITRRQFGNQVVSLAGEVFAAAPAVEEVDLWASVPIAVAKGVVVSGDLAKPTSRTVFSVTVKRVEAPDALQRRIDGESGEVFWDKVWSHSAFRGPS